MKRAFLVTVATVALAIGSITPVVAADMPPCDANEDVSPTVPVGVLRLDLAGRDMVDYLAKLKIEGSALVQCVSTP